MSIEDELKNLVDKTDQLKLQEDVKLQAEQELQNKRSRGLMHHYFKATAKDDNGNQVSSTEEEVSLGSRRKENENKNSLSKLRRRSQLAQIEPVRFYGKNYHIWAQQMKVYLKKLKVAYVLCKPCPTIMVGPEASPEEIAQSVAARQKWMNDDTKCGRTILCHLSVCLTHAYSQKKKTMSTAKELWKDLELKFGTEVSTTETTLIEKYIKFRILRTKPIVDQVQEFNAIFDSLCASGMVVDEKFHVNVLITKLPTSWKSVFNRMIGKEYLSSLAMVMDCLKVEEARRLMRKRPKLHHLHA